MDHDHDEQPTLFELTEQQQVFTDLAEVQAANKKMFLELKALEARPDPTGILMLRLETLIEMALDEDSRARVNLVFERKVTPVLTACLEEATRRRLTQGVGSTTMPGGQQLYIAGS